ncbi:hypothetical protein TNCV_3734871 [Trichonephila clavipes]|nr:hypothetical protein TNCV_3734871 [Trichonephila clavipes]
MEVVGSAETNDIAQPKASSNSDIDDIKNDLANQGLPVMKVAQLTQQNQNSLSPLFLIEIRKTFWTVGTFATSALADICPLLGIRSEEDQVHRSATTATTSTTVR